MRTMGRSRVASWLLPTAMVLMMACVQSPTVIGADGLWTVRRLGFRAQSVTPAARLQLVARYRLPAAAKQGEDRWYLLRLHSTLHLAEDTGAGFVYVSAETNGRTAAQNRFEVFIANSEPVIHWDTVDIINGPQHFFSIGTHVDTIFVNYLQRSGVIPGMNALTVSVETIGDARVEQVVVGDDSGIARTPLSPPRVTMEAVGPEHGVGLGDTFRVHVRLADSGGYSSRDVNLSMRYPRDALRVQGSERWYFPTLGSGAAAEVTFEVLRAGHHDVEFAVKSGSGGAPTAKLLVRVDES